MHRRTYNTILAQALYIVVLGALFAAPAAATPAQPEAIRDARHDFDFEFGAWRMQLARRLHPLTGSHSWVNYAGTSVVREVWHGRANLGEIELAGPAGRIEGLSLRLYDRLTRRWRITFANSTDCVLGQAMIGNFRNGRGEFADREPFGGRTIDVRFVFSDIRPRSFRFEQAFSADSGSTWETNWIATFVRIGPPARPVPGVKRSTRRGVPGVLLRGP